MHTTINDSYLKERLRAAGRQQWIGLALVIGSFVLSLFPGLGSPDLYWLILLAYPALIAGFPLWQYGRGRVRYWKAMQQVPAALAEEIRLTPKQHLFGFVPLDGSVLDFVLVAPEGLYLIEMKGITEGLVATGPGGATEYKTGGFQITTQETPKGDRWSQRLPLLERLARMGEPGLGNPSQALETKIAKLKTWLAAQGPNLAELPVWGVVVFRNPKTPLDIEGSTYEVVHLNEFRSFLSFGQYFDQNMLPVLSADERNRVGNALRGLLGAEVVTVQPVTPKAPARKLSPEARAEQERVKAIREARAAQQTATPARKPGDRRPPGNVSAPPGDSARRGSNTSDPRKNP